MDLILQGKYSKLELLHFARCLGALLNEMLLFVDAQIEICLQTFLFEDQTRSFGFEIVQSLVEFFDQMLIGIVHFVCAVRLNLRVTLLVLVVDELEFRSKFAEYNRLFVDLDFL